jgi:hypothetical protein
LRACVKTSGMNETDPEDRDRKPAGENASEARAARLKAALRVNIARRKAQARARAAGSDRSAGGEENMHDE